MKYIHIYIKAAVKRTFEAKADQRAAPSSVLALLLGYTALERHSLLPKKENVLWQNKWA